jgi:hypothetical protein
MSPARLLRLGSLAVALCAAPLAFSAERGVEVQAACGQGDLQEGGGPCCTAENNTCISNGVRVNSAYLKPWYDLGACG